MKIAKALKLKNQLAGEIAHLKGLLESQNCRPAKQPFDYNNAEVLKELKAKVDRFARIKAAIAAANSEIYDKIFLIAELKGLIKTLKSLDTRNGIIYEGGYTSPNEVEYIAQIKRSEADREICQMQAKIILIQEELDQFNFTHSIPLEEELDLAAR
jgi:inosine/xanthosine triphosphate pyrophosphatase family protein